MRYTGLIIILIVAVCAPLADVASAKTARETAEHARAQLDATHSVERMALNCHRVRKRRECAVAFNLTDGQVCVGLITVPRYDRARFRPGLSCQ